MSKLIALVDLLGRVLGPEANAGMPDADAASGSCHLRGVLAPSESPGLRTATQRDQDEEEGQEKDRAKGAHADDRAQVQGVANDRDGHRDADGVLGPGHASEACRQTAVKPAAAVLP